MPTYVTWNMQGAATGGQSKWGAGGVEELIGNYRPEVLFLQECGQPPGSAKTIHTDNDGGIYTWRGYTIAYYEWDTGARRCNQAVLIKAPAEGILRTLSSAVSGPQWRDILCVISPDGNQAFCSIHAISGGGADVRGLLKEALFVAPDVMVAGDFNREPQTLVQLGVAQDQIVFPPQPTHPTMNPRSTLDYCVINNPSRRPRPRAQAVGTSLQSDHKAVVFTLDFN